MTLEHKINTSFIRRIGNAASSALSALSGVGKYVALAGLGITALTAYSCGNETPQSSATAGYSEVRESKDATEDTAPDTHPYSKTCLIDKDNDNYGIKENNVFVGWDEECPKGYKILEPPFDCNDKIKSINPGAKELCNNLDDNCNGEIDEGLSIECNTSCGKGKMVCKEGKYLECDAPLPQNEICDGKDNNCNGKKDELITCCEPGDVSNKVTCPDGTVKSEDICKNYEWQSKLYLEDCPCKKYKWVCIDQKIGKTCTDPMDTSYVQQNPTDQDFANQAACLNNWCCHNSKGEDVECEYGYLSSACNCVSHFMGFDERGEAFFSEDGACPDHNICELETLIVVEFRNLNLSPAIVWINWTRYGYPPGEKKLLKFGESAVYTIDSSMIPEEGTPIQICNSYDGCTEEIDIECGQKETFYSLVFGNASGCKQCNRETEVNAVFSNYKTMDLQVWLNWLSPGFPPLEKVVVHPEESEAITITQANLHESGANIQLCTSSYGCSKAVYVGCGSKMDFSVEWVFGNVDKNNEGGI